MNFALNEVTQKPSHWSDSSACRLGPVLIEWRRLRAEVPNQSVRTLLKTLIDMTDKQRGCASSERRDEPKCLAKWSRSSVTQSN